MRQVVLVVAALVLVFPAANAQQVGILTRNATLRSGPSSAADKLAVLEAGDAVTLLDDGHQAGYVRVRTQTEDVGWVWERFVRLVDPTELHQPTVPHTFVPAPATVSVAPGDFDGCPD